MIADVSEERHFFFFDGRNVPEMGTFTSEDEGNAFSRNVCNHTESQRPIAEDLNSQKKLCENLKRNPITGLDWP